MKKLTAIILSAVILVSVFSFFSCDKETVKSEAYKLYSQALEKMEKLSSVEADMSIAMTVNTPSQSSVATSVTMLYNVKQVNGKGTDDDVTRMTCKINSNGFVTDMDVYAVNGWTYVDMRASIADQQINQKYKVPLADADLDTGMIDSAAVEYPPELLEKVTVKNESDGSKSIEFSLSEKDMMKLYGDLLGAALSSVAGESEVDIDNVNIKMVIDKNGYLDTINMNISITVMSVTMSMVLKVEYVDPGKEVTVTPIEGYESFPVLSLENE